mgnify:CR=1 FL=1
MSTTTLEAFPVIGISVRTSNQDNRAMKDIPALWQRFQQENVLQNIPNMASGEVYCIYTEYEGDHMQPYTVVIGCQVSNLEEVPEGMTSLTIQAGSYERFEAKGNMLEGAVAQAWYAIWTSELDRCYQTDFEVYGEDARDMTNARVDVMVGVK